MAHKNLATILFTILAAAFSTVGAVSWASPYKENDHLVERAGAALSKHLDEFRADQEAVRSLRALEQAKMEMLAPGSDAPSVVTPTVPTTISPSSDPQVFSVVQSKSVQKSDFILGEGSSAWIDGQNDPAVTGIQPIAGREALLVSYVIPPGDPMQSLKGRSWTYDNAAGAVALLMQGNSGEAQQILAALQGLMNPNGTLGFSYQVDSAAMDPTVRTGTMAWVGYAMAYYQRVTGDASFQSSAEQIASYLKNLQRADGLFKGGPTVSWVSTEHNVDAYFFYRELYRITGQSQHLDTAGQVRDGILANLWTGNGQQGHFLQGLNDPTAALDANALGAMFLSAIGDENRAERALEYVEATFKNKQTITGSRTAINGYSPDSAKKTVWLEGTLQVAAAYLSAGKTKKADSIFKEVSKIQKNWESRGIWHGALPYAMPRYINPDGDTFSEFESVVSTSWLLVAQDVQGGSSLFWDRD